MKNLRLALSVALLAVVLVGCRSTKSDACCPTTTSQLVSPPHTELAAQPGWTLVPIGDTL